MLPDPNQTLAYLKLLGVSQVEIAEQFKCDRQLVSTVIYSPQRKRRQGSKSELICVYLKTLLDQARAEIKQAA